MHNNSVENNTIRKGKNMTIKPSALRKILSGFLRNLGDANTEYEVAAMAALKRSGFDKVLVFTHNEHLVMINTIADIESVESGIILNEEETEIIDFCNSLDHKSVTVDALARCLIMETVTDESDILRLLLLSKHQCNWIIHHVSNETSPALEEGARKRFPEFICNTHTHGLSAYTHKDFQIILDIGEESAMYILNAFAERVRGGEVFSPGELVKGVYPECDVRLAAVKEGGRDVLRILIPDENNVFPGERGCLYPYSEQARVLE